MASAVRGRLESERPARAGQFVSYPESETAPVELGRGNARSCFAYV